MTTINAHLEVTGRTSPLLTADALHFIESLERQFGPRRLALLARRSTRTSWDFLPETEAIRKADWRASKIPEVLLDRRVEITGPAEPKMIINALNSGANVFMADFEDSLAPTWNNIIEGQEALEKAVRHTLAFTSPEGKDYRLNKSTAVLFVRPRGWALEEAHVRLAGRPISAALFDFGLFCFHNAKEQVARGVGPFFYLPKLEGHLEARLWNDVFVQAQSLLGIPHGSIKATVLVETLPAAFEMDEILYELREHSAGLNCGRLDYIFSFIKKQPESLLPDRAELTMDKGFLRAYVQQLISTCHRRGTHAMGGMAAQIPIKNDPVANEAALAKVRADKLREVHDGHDGTWVAHPGLVAIAKEIFDVHMKGKNQLGLQSNSAPVTREDLLRVPKGECTEAGLRANVRVGVRYMEAWLRGQGCVPLDHVMEDAATAEIARAGVWQQVHHKRVDAERLDVIMNEELAPYQGGEFPAARALFRDLSTRERCEEFLTIPAYALLLQRETPSHA